MLGKNKNNKNKGQVLVLVALSLVVIIGFAALAIDVAYFYHTKNQLQGAADAAALAGASQLRGASTVGAFGNHSSVRREAWKFACNNKAAGQDVYLDAAEADKVGCDNIPSIYNIGNAGDIIVGNWSGSFTPGGTPVNAVKVVARREEGATYTGGGVTRFFGRIFTQTQQNISATAIAATFPAEVLPIAVNEYWLGWVAPPGPGNTKRPYDNEVHKYPRSFVRKTTIPIPPATSGIDNVPSSSNPNGSWGRIFAILGSEAGSNVTPQNINSYVYLDLRSKRHDGSGASWFDLNPDANVTCATCSNGFYNQTGLPKTTGDVSPQKFREHLKYLHQGFPENYLLPTAVMEQYRAGYTASNYPIPTSECPYATVAYFPSGGGQPINKDKALEDEYEGKKFYERFPKGKKVVALVYDGTYVPTSPSPNAVTIVGYVLLEIDGYASAAPQGLDLDKANNKLKDKGSTAYAHAISDIEEPSSSFGTCDTSFFDAVQALRVQGGSFRIVE